MTKALPFLPYGKQTIDDEDIAAVTAALRDEMLTTGPKVEAFDFAFAKASGANAAICCSSGTAALHLAMLALDMKPGEVSIVPAITFMATANAARYCGSDVVFSDVDPDSGLMRPKDLEEALRRANARGRARVAVPVHLNGQVADMVALAEVSRGAGIDLVEDACHALGPAGVGACAHSKMAAFSTHPVKAITTGEGGVVTTADHELAGRLRLLRSHGIERNPERWKRRDLGFDPDGTPNPWYHEAATMGWNFRLPDIMCALGISQLSKLADMWNRRKAIAAMYDKALAPLAPLLRPVARNPAAAHGWHLYAILVDFEALRTTRGKFMRRLRDKGIGTQVHYIPLHLQPQYRSIHGEQPLPGAEAYYARCLSIPIYPNLTDGDVARVCDTLSSVIHTRAA